MEDSQGLYFENIPPDTSWYRDLEVSMKRGDVKEMSFGFQVIKDEWDAAYKKRTLHEIRLLEISVVTFPAYPQTSAKVRALPNGTTLDRLAEIIGKRQGGAQLDEAELSEVWQAVEYLRSIGPEPVKPTPPEEPPIGTHYRNHLVDLEAALAQAL
jgi:hypothetical protein